MSDADHELPSSQDGSSGPSAGALTRSPSFFQPVDQTQRDPLYREYIGFLGQRNGEMDMQQRRFARREVHLAQLAASRARFSDRFDQELFRAQYARFDKSRPTDDATNLLLMFCKINAGEAFGVEVMREALSAHAERSEPRYQAEQIVMAEEDYHTKLFVGATQYFGVDMNMAFVPPVSLRIFIHGLAKMPPSLFHSVLLAAELSGVYIFNTMLYMTRRVMRDHPEVRDAMEERLCEVLIDEIGHVTYNRLALGPGGLWLARQLYPLVYQGVAELPEARALRHLAQGAPGVAEMDYGHLPEEVRRRAFFL